MALPVINAPTYKMTLPSTQKEISFRPFLVKEEKLFLLLQEGEDNTSKYETVKDIINNCTFNKLNVETLTNFDLEWIFLQLRIKSKGEITELTFECPECGKATPIRFDLNDVTIERDENHTAKIELTDKIGLKMKYPNFKTFVDMNMSEKEMEVTDVIANCVEYVYEGETVYNIKDEAPEELTEFIESLNGDQAAKIQEFFETMPKIKAIVPYECAHCGHKEKVEVTGLDNFLS